MSHGNIFLKGKTYLIITVRRSWKFWDIIESVLSLCYYYSNVWSIKKGFDNSIS